MLVKCNWKTCIDYKNGFCGAPAIELKSFDYEDDEGVGQEGLLCSGYKYDTDWMKRSDSNV